MNAEGGEKQKTTKIEKSEPNSWLLEWKREIPSERMWFIRKCCSLMSLLCGMNCVFLCFVLLIGGVGTVVSILLTSELLTSRWNSQFLLIYSRIESVMTGPKLIVDTLAPTMNVGLFNFSKMTYEMQRNLTYLALNNNFFRTKLNGLTLYTANGGDVDQFTSFWRFRDLRQKHFRRYKGYDNTSALITHFCTPNNHGQCINGTEKYYPWNKYGSITHQSQFLPGPTFVSPYLFYCPGRLCDIFLAYTHPYFLPDGSYYGTIGVAFESLTLRQLLLEATPGKSKSFIVEIGTGFLISVSSHSGKIMQMKGDPPKAELIVASDHPYDEEIKTVVRHIKCSFSGHLNKMKEEKTYSDSVKWARITYARYNSDGADWLIVVVSPRYEYASSLSFAITIVCLTVLGLIISCAGVCWGHIKIVMPLNRLGFELRRCNTLDSIEEMYSKKRKLSNVYEIRHLQRQFVDLLGKLMILKSFVPFHVKRLLSKKLNRESQNLSEVVEKDNDRGFTTKERLKRDSIYRRTSVTQQIVMNDNIYTGLFGLKNDENGVDLENMKDDIVVVDNSNSNILNSNKSEEFSVTISNDCSSSQSHDYGSWKSGPPSPLTSSDTEERSLESVTTSNISIEDGHFANLTNIDCKPSSRHVLGTKDEYQFKSVVLVHVYWKMSEMDCKNLNLLFPILAKKVMKGIEKERGTLFGMKENGFLVGFESLNSKKKKAVHENKEEVDDYKFCCRAAGFALSLISQRDIFDLYVSIAPGKCKFGILGCYLQRTLVIDGPLKTFCEAVSHHAAHVLKDCRILCSRGVFDILFAEFDMRARDFVFHYDYGSSVKDVTWRSEFEIVSELVKQRVHLQAENEWMYERQRLLEREDRLKEYLVWKFMLLSQRKDKKTEKESARRSLGLCEKTIQEIKESDVQYLQRMINKLKKEKVDCFQQLCEKYESTFQKSCQFGFCIGQS